MNQDKFEYFFDRFDPPREEVGGGGVEPFQKPACQF